MKNKQQIIKEIDDRFNINYSKTDVLSKRENASYTKYASTWAGVVSVDIVNFKKMVSGVNIESMVKIVQSFNQLISETARSDAFIDIFRDIYFVGDEVIVVFSAGKKSEITSIIDFSFHINSIINGILRHAVIKNAKGITDFKVGIGIWVSSDNTIIMSGQKSSPGYNNTTLIGSAINYASKLAKIANRNGFVNYPILMNDIAHHNSHGDQKESLRKWMNKIAINIGDESYVWGGKIIKTKYE